MDRGTYLGAAGAQHRSGWNAIRRRRRKLSLTQDQLGQRSGMRQATVSALESGDSSARLKTLFDLLAALELEIVIRPRTQSPKIEDIF